MNAVVPSIIGVLLATGVAVRPAAQDVQALRSFSSTVNLVALDVTVQDAASRYVPGLKLPDFAVFEDGVSQQVRFLEQDTLPIDLIVMIDTSRSMLDKMAIVQRAARGFLETLRPCDRGAVIAFNDRVSVLQSLTSDRPALARAVTLTDIRGDTALRTALYVALKEYGRPLRSDSPPRRQAIALLSDGEDTASLTSFDDLMTLVRQTGVNVYTVRLLSKEDLGREAGARRRQDSAGDYEMKALARETGALSFFPVTDQLPSVYGAIARELASQYSLGYEPSNGATDRRLRHVSVQIVNRPELRARTRTGYTLDARRGETPR